MSNGHHQPEPRSINIDVRNLFLVAKHWDGQRLASVLSPEGDEHNHPIAVRINRGGEITEVTTDGTRVSRGAASGRGVRIEIDFDPEAADDPWTLALYFHKGETYVEVLQRRGDRADAFSNTIWRN